MSEHRLEGQRSGVEPPQGTIAERKRNKVLMLFMSVVGFAMLEYTVGSHLSELQLSKHAGYPNGFNKATPTISGYFRRCEAVQMADIECFRARSTCCIAAEDTG